MKNEIISNIENPAQPERLYRSDKSSFKKAIQLIYPENGSNPVIATWYERLHYSEPDISWGGKNDLVFVILATLIAGTIAKLPAFLNINEDFFYPRNIGFILFPVLTAYFAWKNNLSPKLNTIIAAISLFGLFFINALPDIRESDSILLSCIHLLIVLWFVLRLAFTGKKQIEGQERLAFLHFNGDLVVITALILIAGAILTGLTVALFSVIDIQVEGVYFEYILAFALPAAPIVGTYLIRANPQLVGKVSPVIAKIFSPVVLIIMLIYLVAMVFSGKDPYTDREFLLIFNALLIAVMAIIFFSIAGTVKTGKTRNEVWVLFLLSALTIMVNGIALSAILFRISEWGITPNRVAVLGGNILILVNLVMVTIRLFKSTRKNSDLSNVANAIASFLPVYFFWAAMVTFLFPFLFDFK